MKNTEVVAFPNQSNPHRSQTRLCSLFLPQQLHIRLILTEKCGYQ